MVLTDGNWFSPIEITMDVETGSAYDVETISMLAACEIARVAGNEIEINTDCEGGKTTLENKSGNFKPLLGGWDVPENVTFNKVKAHPEMWGTKGIWDINEKGNWLADHVADGITPGVRKISAKDIIRDIGRKAEILLVDKAGIPFFGDLKKSQNGITNGGIGTGSISIWTESG